MEKYIRLAVITLGVYLLVRFLLPLVYPFVIAAFIVIPLYPWLEKVEKKLKIRKSILAVLLLFVGGGAVVLLLWAGASWLFSGISQLAGQFDMIQSQFHVFVTDCCQFMESKTGLDGASLVTVIMEKADIFIENFQINVVPKMMKESVSYLKILISAGAFIAVTFIAAILFAKDYSRIKEALRKNPGFESAVKTGASLGKMILTFLRAQCIILLSISVISSIVLLIAGIKGAVGIGIFAGIMDALPFIGTGIVLLPLAVWQLVQGEFLRAGLCAAAYVICALAREFLEPKLIGERMGVFPVFILLSVYAGVKLFGIGGIFLGPLSFLLIRELAGEKENKE